MTCLFSVTSIFRLLKNNQRRPVLKNTRKILSLLLALALLLCLVPATAFAQDENETEIISSACILKVTPTTILVKTLNGLEYRIDGGAWSSESVFSGLYPNTTHSVQYRYNGGSAVSLGEVTTPEVNPADGKVFDTDAPYQLAKTGYLSTFELKNDLSYYLYLSANKYSDYTDLRLYVMHKTYSGNNFKSWKVSILPAPASTTTYSGATCYQFVLKGLAAAELMDEIYITLYAKEKTTGNTYITPVYKTSMGTTARSLLSQASSDSKKETLIKDFLHYAAAAQTYFSYNTNHLANEGISASTTGNPTLSTVNKVKTPLENPSATFGNTALILDSKISLRVGMKFTESSTISDTSKVKLKISYKSSNSSLGTIKQTYSLKGNQTDGYYFLINDVAAADFGQTLNMTIYNGSTAISNTHQYSIETRVNSMLNSATNQNLINLLWALAKYGRSARAFFS